MNKISHRSAPLTMMILLSALVCAVLITISVHQATPVSAQAPKLTAVELVTGLDIPWDLAFTPDGTMLITERGSVGRDGRISARLTNGSTQVVEADMTDFYSTRELGLMGIAVDPDFVANRRFYTCQGHKDPQETQVIAWTINASYTQAQRVNDPLVGGIPEADSHNGCRLHFGSEGYLYISTGDARTGTSPQDLNSLAGKILRVNAADGSAPTDNPFVESENANAKLVYTYGHRNPQGLALRPGTSQMWSIEHGPNIDDEINLLIKGGNYGWDPASSKSSEWYTKYDNGVSMTDKTKYPQAISAKYSTGNLTLATSGGTFLSGNIWGNEQGYLAVATLKDRTLYLFKFDDSGQFIEKITPELRLETGEPLDYRFRSPVIGPNNALYLTTSNGGEQDVILRIVPDHALATFTEFRPPEEDSENDNQEESDQETPEDEENEVTEESSGLLTIGIVAGSLLLLAIGGSIIFIILNKKKNQI